jgi:DNA-binding NarL/FixJ family response regulator
MAHVALIDDEHGPIDYYEQALTESGHRVERFDTVEGVFVHLENKRPADIYVVDIMMPTHGHPRLKEAANGLASGIVLHREIRNVFPNVPIIILTSISNPEILESLPVDEKTRIESKIDILPFELVGIIESVVSADAKT